MAYNGDFNPGDTINLKFTTVDGTGLPTALSGGAVSVYKDGSLTQSTAGVTLTANFDGVTGLNNVLITLATDGTYYSGGSNFQVVLTAGTVGGVSVVGYVTNEFSLNARSALRPTTAGETLDLTVGAVTVDNVGPTAVAIADEVQTRTIAGVTTVGTVNAVAAAVITAIWANSTRSLTTFGTLVADISSAVAAIDPTAAADLDALVARFTTAMTESYAADGAVPTPDQALQMILQRMTDFNISGTTLTVRKRDGSTTAYTLTLNSATNPTASTQS